jgi:hypothetical protein
MLYIVFCITNILLFVNIVLSRRLCIYIYIFKDQLPEHPTLFERKNEI